MVHTQRSTDRTPRRQGRYLPAFASYVYDQNQIAQAEGRETLNLASVLIGNGIVDIST